MQNIFSRIKECQQLMTFDIKGKILIYTNMLIIFRVPNLLCFTHCTDGLNIMLAVSTFMLTSAAYRHAARNAEHVELFLFMLQTAEFSPLIACPL